MFNTPILVIAYNRPDKLKILLGILDRLKPPKLYFTIDGPKNFADELNVKEVKDLVKSEINWNCSVKLNINQKNLGCKGGVYSGINWFFQNEEFGIILEDDCIPSISFFNYCQELLLRYNDNTDISCISGHNRFNYYSSNDYCFIRYPLIWGWATWKRVWQNFDVDLKNYSIYDLKKATKNLPRKTKYFFYDAFYRCKKNKIDTWDYQYIIYNLIEDYKCIIPKTNLIKNIGFDDSATHTKNPNHIMGKLLANEINFPLKHPKILKIDLEMQNHYNQQLFFKNSLYEKIINKIYEICTS